MQNAVRFGWYRIIYNGPVRPENNFEFHPASCSGKTTHLSYFKKMKLRCLICLIMFFPILPSWGQATLATPGTMRKDSILRLLQNSQHDTQMVNLHREAGISILYEQPAEAIPHFQKGIEIAKKSAFYPGLERGFTSLSLAHSLTSRYDSALVYIDTAIQYARITGNKERIALCYLNKADVLTNLQDLGGAVKYCDSAMIFAEAGGYRAGQARIYSVLSDIYAAQGNYPQAFENLDKSLVLFDATKNRQMVAMTHFGRAVLLQDQQKLEEAIPYFKLAIHIADSIRDFSSISSYTGALAQTYAMLKRYPESEKMIQRSLDYALQLKNRKQEAIAYDFFFNVYLEQEQYAKAISYELKAYEIMKEEKDLLREQSIVTNLATAYEAAGKPAEAYQYLKISQQLNDSMLRQQFNDETARLQTQFEVSEKNKSIALLNKDQQIKQQKIRQQELIIGGVAIIALLAVITIAIVINRNKLRQRMNELQLRNSIAADLHDEVGSSLSSIHMLSEMASLQADPESKESPLLKRVSTHAKETMDKMSDIVWMVKPEEEDERGLVERIEKFAYDITNSTNIELKLELEALEKMKLTPAKRKNIYLFLKEATNNAAKYSGSPSIEISAVTEQKLLRLTVTDFGKGFDMGTVRKGQGLHNMEQRAKEINAKFEISSSKESGTKLEFVLEIPSKLLA
jgi:two-component system, NarL family, sensor histidine kinase UhpB